MKLQRDNIFQCATWKWFGVLSGFPIKKKKKTNIS